MLKKLISRFFLKKNNTISEDENYITVTINDRIMPIDRGMTYEDPLDELLELKGYGVVTGGGTMQEKNGEISFCDIEIKLNTKNPDREILLEIIEKLETLGAPKGSVLTIEKTKEKIKFGKLEGLALYLDRTHLSKETNLQYNSDSMVIEIKKLIDINDKLIRSWRGETEMGFYFYTASFDTTNNTIMNSIKTDPLYKGVRIVRIA